MVNLIASPNRVLQFGYEWEDNVTQIIFNYDESWLSYGDGEFKVRVLRPGDKEAYNATNVVDNRSLMTLVMTVTDIELSRKGRGELQLVYICHDVVKKSEIYTFVVRRAIDSEVVNPPKGSIIAEVEESLSEIKDEIGNLDDLSTTNKTDLITAINEVNEKASGKTIDVDSELIAVSTNPLQNKIITLSFMNALDRLERDESQISDNAQNVSGLQNDVADMQTSLKGKVDDVQINGTSVVSDGVAKIPIATGIINGVVKVDEAGTYGIRKWSNTHALLVINSATSSFIKNPNSGTADFRPLTPNRQHESTFYGLAKAAGDTTQSASSNAVGTYTEEAKSAISDMLNGAVTVSGTTPTITALSSVRYVCGEVATLDITPCASGICDIVFTSGSTATVLTLPNTVKFPDGAFTPEANTTYELNIMDGVYGVYTSWT